MPSGGNTALGYQMMLEGVILHAMTNAADKGNFFIASAYANAYADLIGFTGDNKLGLELPNHPATGLPKTQAEVLGAWQKYYFDMLSVMFKAVHGLLTEIRQKYRKNKDIPEFTSPLAEAN